MAQFRFAFTARSYDSTVAFYTDVLRLEVVHSWDDHGRGTIVAAADGQIEMFDGDPDSDVVNGVALAWEIDDIDEEYERLRALGVEFLAPPQDQPWGHRNATFAAPEGLAITLFTDVGDAP
ncbi:MAG: VOC family protein [Acidimicrobiales bacterium]